MRIRGLTPVMINDLTTQKLKDTAVVIDMQSVFFTLYKQSQLPYLFGCESDKFASFLRKYLEKFKKANLQCLFVIKGGHADQKKLEKHFEAENRLHGRNYSPNEEYDDIIKPLFSKDIWFQTLNEMGFKHVICDGDHITECISLALKMNCPIIGNNMQYFFSQVQYIPESKTTLDENNNLLCVIHTLTNFLKMYNLTEEKILSFIMLTDQHMFEETNITFNSLFQSNRLMSRSNTVNHKSLLKWLSRKTAAQIETEILSTLSKSYQALYKEKKNGLEKLTEERKHCDTKTTLYATDQNKAKFIPSDPDWFEKGVFHNHIAIPYVNLYRYKIVKASNFIEDYDQENSIMVSIDIIKYAFDLLTNFEGGEINVEHKKDHAGDLTDQTLKYEFSIRKPEYEANLSVFENGWDSMKELNLFKHFVTESLQSFDFSRLDGVPKDAKLLLIALVYFSRKRPEAKSEIYSILLSYVMLGVVFEKLNKSVNDFKSTDDAVSEKPFLDSFTDKDSVTAVDCDVAGSLMSKYFKLRKDERCAIFDRKTLHPLVEFQRCLEELNYLNQLCGREFDPTIYRKTYNGTFVYKILRAMRDHDGLEFIKTKLNPAPTVLAFLTGMIEIYESILYEY